jgi:hypothetical protein
MITQVTSSQRTQAPWDTVGVSLKHDLEPDRFFEEDPRHYYYLLFILYLVVVVFIIIIIIDIIPLYIYI